MKMPQRQHQYDDESILLRCKDIHDILAYFPKMELIREDLTIICRVCIPKNTTTLFCPTGSALPAGMFSVRESMDKRDTDIILRSVYLDRHLKRDAHKDAISQNKNTTIKMRNESNRNNAIALRVGCACYKNTIVDDRILIMKMRYFCYTNVELT